MAPAGFLPVPQSPRGSIPIRRAWGEKTGTITPGTDAWADKTLSQGDLAAIEEALAQIKSCAGERMLMLFYGAGTGNPDTAWGNNTELKTEAQAEVVSRQRNPGFVRAELTKSASPFFVVALNFNRQDGAKPVVLDEQVEGRGIRLTVNAPFPLRRDTGEYSSKAWTALRELAVKAGRNFALMNAINQNNYAHMLEMVPRGGSYLTSYAGAKEGTPMEVAYTNTGMKPNPDAPGGVWYANTEPRGFATRGDVNYGAAQETG
jgi:hypothetical protein